MLKLIKCEFLKLKRKPLVLISLLLSVFMPLAYAFFLADVNTDVDAVNGVMSSLFQLSAYLLLMPLLVILASNLLFEELDNDTLKNLVTIPVNRTKLVLSKMMVLLLSDTQPKSHLRSGRTLCPGVLLLLLLLYKIFSYEFPLFHAKKAGYLPFYGNISCLMFIFSLLF